MNLGGLECLTPSDDFVAARIESVSIKCRLQTADWV